MSSRMPYKVLCVCLGNICRSPTAEVVLRHFCEQQQLNVIVDSAGTSNYHPNKAPDLRSQKHAIKRGYDLSSLRARQLKTQDFLDFDLILAMDHENFDNIHALVKDAVSEFGASQIRAKIALMSEQDHCIHNKPYLILTMVQKMVLNVSLISVSRAVRLG